MADANFDTGTNHLQFELTDGVAIVTLNRPEARNALSDEMTGALRRALVWCATADQVGALVLTGSGRAFCAGGDVKAMGQRTVSAQPTVEQQFQALRSRHREIAGALTALRIPTIAVLPGPAAGAGLAIALACDMRLAARDAFMSTAYARVGLSGDYGIAWLLTRVVGPARARQLLLTAERVTAEAALGIGLVNEITSADDLRTRALELATQLARGPRVAYAYIKDNLDEALTVDHLTAIDREADRLLKARTTEDHREAVRAFAEKRDPTFTGR